MSSSPTKPTEQPVERPIKVQKRRSEDEMRNALAAFVMGKARQRDDEWEIILSDAISEVIEWRRIGVHMTQAMIALQHDVTDRIQQIGQK